MPSHGDIVLARFAFTDGSGAKLRPVLVLARVPGRHDDFLVAYISSRLAQAVQGFDVVIDSNDTAFQASGLKVTSVIRVGKISSITRRSIVGALGQLDERIMHQVSRRLMSLLAPARASS